MYFDQWTGSDLLNLTVPSNGVVGKDRPLPTRADMFGCALAAHLTSDRVLLWSGVACVPVKHNPLHPPIVAVLSFRHGQSWPVMARAALVRRLCAPRLVFLPDRP